MPEFDNITSRAEAREGRTRTFRKRKVALVSVVSVFLAVFGGLTAFGTHLQDTTILMAQNTANRQGVDVAPEQTRTSGAPEETVVEETSGSEPEADAGEEPIDVLILGVDKRPDGGSEGMGVRSDSIIVARIQPDTGETRLLSIPRDLYVEIEPGEKDRINSAYAIGGVDQTRSIVERYTGIGIDHYAVIDFEGFEEAVDALGGVKVDVREGEYPENWNVEPGKQRLNGTRALMYARYRESAGGDIDRIGHQQQILSAVKGKMLSVGVVTKLPELLEATNGNVESDVGPREAIEFARALAATQNDSNAGVEAFQIKGEGTYLEDGRQVLTPLDEENREIISDFLG